MMSRSGPAYLPMKLSDAVSTTLLVEPARRLSPCGAMALSSAPPQPSVSPTRPPRKRLYTRKRAITMNGIASISPVVHWLSDGR